MDKMSFNEIYKKLLKGDMSCEEASNIMNESWVKSLVNSYINKDKINRLVPYFEEDIQNIFMIINITQFIYNNSGCSTGLSDYDYDILYSIMIDNSETDVISAPIIQNHNPITTHKYPSLRGTLTKVYYLTLDEKRTNPSRKYLDEWKSSMETKIYNNSGRTINLDNEEIYVFPKFDGVSGIFEMSDKNSIERVLTRGYTETNEAEDITHIFQNLKDREYCEFIDKEYGLKTEIMMQEDDLEYYNEKYNTDYKNSRSIVSAIINSDEYDAEKSSLLHIVPLRVSLEDGTQELAKEVFTEYPYIRCRLKDREVIRKFANEHRYIHGGLRCDGAVIYIINPEIQKILGRENHKNNFEVAYKFTEEVTTSKLLGITFNVGLFGRIAPVAKIKPVKLKGNTIENISLGSIGRMRELGLRKGDTVKVLYDIIPYLSFDDECAHGDGELLEIPEYCPECGSKLEFSESYDIASCINPECPCRQKGKILNYLNKMNIDGISYGIIDKLFDYGFVKSIKDLYHIKDNITDISIIDGFGIRSVSSWIESIEKQRVVSDYVVLGSLGIEGISKKLFEKIMRQMTLSELLGIVDSKDVNKLIEIPGIQIKTAQKIIDGIKSNLKLIKFLKKELSIVDTYGKQESLFSVCFTKIRDKDKENFIYSHGGIVTDSLTKDTTFLVVPDLSIESSKITKAKKYGIKIIHIDDMESEILAFLNK